MSLFRSAKKPFLLMRLLDEQYTRTPFYGQRKMMIYLAEQGYAVDRKRVRRLMQQMGLETIYPKPHLSKPGTTSMRYPYLSRNIIIDRIDQVWSSDITYTTHLFLFHPIRRLCKLGPRQSRLVLR